MANLQGKSVLLVVASGNFRDEEYAEPRRALEAAGARVTVASSRLGTLRGMLGMTIEPDVLIGDVDADDYDAVVFVGGTGATEYFDDPTAHALAKQAAQSNRLTAAICLAPSILARAGLLQGKRATVYASEAATLEAKGADYTGAAVERDGNILTGEGPHAAKQFSQRLVEALAE